MSWDRTLCFRDSLHQQPQPLDQRRDPMVEVQGFIPAYGVRSLLASGLIQYLPRAHRLEVALFIQ